MSKIEAGSPVILEDARDMESHGLKNGMQGFANSVVDLGHEGEFVFFMPDGVRKSFVMNVNRFKFDQERYEEMNGSDS